MFAVGVAFAISACGGDDETTTSTETDIETTTEQTQSQPTATTSAPKPTTTSTASGPSACGPNQAFSQVSKTCVNTNPSGNPCPKGEVPMADRPICVKE
jgi:hypothetical protein